MSFAGMMLVGLILDLCIGWPDWLYRRVGHPVTWLGHVITLCDNRLNHGPESRRLVFGAVTCLFVVCLVGLLAGTIQAALPGSAWGTLLGGVFAWPLIAARSMRDHVAAVGTPLVSGNLDEARAAVAMIVGRDPTRLDTAGIGRATLESLAENTSDGIVAPMLWGALAGLPGIAAYKAINTLDSMIGHRSDRYEFFGKVSARLDDAANWIPARISGALFVVAAVSRARRAWQIMHRDARAHRSPNAGWPEAAMAGGLGVRLSGPRIYATSRTDEPWLNGDAPDPVPEDINRALTFYGRVLGLMALGLAAIWWV